jgi:hypothetical protein
MIRSKQWISEGEYANLIVKIKYDPTNVVDNIPIRGVLGNSMFEMDWFMQREEFEISYRLWEVIKGIFTLRPEIISYVLELLLSLRIIKNG